MKKMDKPTAILITGASKRIGKSMALHLAALGENIIVHYGKDKESALDTVQQIKDLGQQAWAIPFDLSQPQNCMHFFDQICQFSNPKIIINNASIFDDIPFDKIDFQRWQNHLNINLASPFFLSQAFAKINPVSGRIINLLDWRALKPGKDHIPYTLSKSALASLTKILAQALSPNISVNAVALGAILPPINSEENPKIVENLPIPRWGELKEVNQIIEFLVFGPSYITGEIIHLDGGKHLLG